MICIARLPGVATADHAFQGSGGDVQALLDKGLYEKAEVAARADVDRISATNGPDSQDTAAATDLLVAALLLNGRGASDTTLALAVRTVRAKEAHGGKSQFDLIPSLCNLADALVAAGDYTPAIENARRAVTLSEKLSASRVVKAEALDRLGAALTAADRNDEAIVALGRSLQVKEAALSASDPRIARTLEAITWALQRESDYDGSRQAIERAARIQEQADSMHPAYAQTLNLLGLQFWFDGNLRAALDVATRAVAVAERTLRPDHPTIARALKYQAGALLYLGELVEARAVFERALGIAERNYGPNHYENYNYVNDLAIAELFSARYTAARRLFERALKLTETKLGKWNERAATTAGNLAVVDARLGDYDAARREQLTAMNIWERVLGRDHVYVAQALSDLAEVYRDQNAPSRALPLLQRALTIRERSMRPDHRDVATTRADLAATLMQLNRLNEAREVAAAAVQAWEGADAPDAPDFARVLALYARIQVASGAFATAREYYERALTIQEKALGREHPAYADTQVGLAAALAALGESSAAVLAAAEGEKTGRNHLRLMLRYLPERQSLSYASKRPRGLDLALSMTTDDQAQRGAVFDALVKSRALVLDEMAARHRLTIDPASNAGSLWTALTAARQRLANLVVRGPLDQEPSQYLKLVDDARREKELAETALAEKSAAFREERKREEIGLNDVRAAMPLRSALVAFARYERTVIEPPAQAVVGKPRPPRTVPSYVAFVLRPDRSDVVMVPLGTAGTIDRRVARWRDEVTNVLRVSAATEAERAYRAAGVPLRQSVWDPVKRYLNDTDLIFVVPDGTLNLISIAALPVGQSKYLIESGPVIHYLSAERDLVSTAIPTTNTRGLLAVGGAAFNDETVFTRTRGSTTPTRTARNVAPGTVRGACGELATLQFPPLNATLDEVRDVQKLWSGSPVRVLAERDASERAFKQDAPGNRALHLATHGFFLGTKCETPAGPPRAPGGPTAPARPRETPGTADNPLLLSGLALAGANHRADAGPTDEDGILTAEEVTSLNLDGVEWAVLSACDTGLGQVKVGEGVFGLRRAFQVAGVHTVIMSLWSVEDESTREWMTALYDGRLKKKLTTAEAVHRATLTVLRDRRAAGQSTHPFYWGGFVAAGDWR
jgi:CHAT domain-containing protein